MLAASVRCSVCQLYAPEMYARPRSTCAVAGFKQYMLARAVAVARRENEG